MYKVDLSQRTMAMLALGSAIYMIALALAQAVIALSGHALVAIGWTIGMVTFVVVVLGWPGRTCSSGSRSRWWPRRSPR